MSLNRHVATWLGCAALMGGLVAGCGDDEGEGGSGGSGGGASTESGSTEGAKKIDPASMEGAKGEITYCQGKDTPGDAKASIAGFNAKFESQGLSAKLVEFPADAQQQRNQFVQRQEAKSGECDVFSADVVWTAEFASQGWLFDMTPYMEPRKDEFIPATLETVTYDKKIWGAPDTSDAGLLYYHKKDVPEVPATWQAVYEDAAKKDGIVYQGAAYEGLTCAFLEIAFAAGGKVLSDDGTKAEFDSPENIEALQFMVDGINDGAAPKGVGTYMEEQARLAFEGGRATYMRNWPYAFATGKKNKDAPEFDVAPFPEYEGGGKAGILGGHNDVISVYSKNPGAALALVDYRTGEEDQIRKITEFSLPVALLSAWEDPKVEKAIPFAADMKQAVEQAKSRPVSPVYPQISEAIYKNVNEALSGSVSAEEAIKNGQADMEKALATF